VEDWLHDRLEEVRREAASAESRAPTPGVARAVMKRVRFAEAAAE
jgi:hypothetical protein